MRTNRNFTLIYILLVIGQILICNFINTGPYLMLSVLPALILCLPPGIPVSLLMLMAAISGLAVDWLSEGITGLNMAALVPVAFVRNTLARLLFGKEHSERSESFSIRKNGLSKVSAAILVCQALFLAIYIIIDGAGVRTIVFNLLKFAISLPCGYLLSLPVVNILTSGDNQEGWK